MPDRDTVLARIAHNRKLAEAARRKAASALSPAVAEHHRAIAQGFETIAAELQAALRD